jgi:uncharacterized protein (DUF1501 family)
MLDRRHFLAFAGTGAALLAAPGMLLAAAPTDRRFVFIIQRGAADGLAILMPYGDPSYHPLRGALTGDASVHRLDGMFALHPALEQTAALYARQQALFIHAVASPYRDRSHFDGQNVLETGGSAPYRLKDGWLNRLVAQIPGAGAIAIAPTVPMALRGKAGAGSYAPSALPEPSDDLLRRVAALYAHDRQLHPLWTAAVEARGAAAGAGRSQDPASLGRLAAAFLSRDDGPRIAMLETGGWDTHNAQAGRLQAQLRGLDNLLGALRDGLGQAWAGTTVLIATEFGRTAAVNGTGGTDHGTAALAWLVGGAVAGGRILADWPGLAPAQLYEGRDLKPTTALDAVIAGAAAEALALEPERVARALFPDAGVRRPLSGLVAA